MEQATARKELNALSGVCRVIRIIRQMKGIFFTRPSVSKVETNRVGAFPAESPRGMRRAPSFWFLVFRRAASVCPVNKRIPPANIYSRGEAEVPWEPFPRSLVFAASTGGGRF